MKGRAYYSEPLDHLPGRLHITKDSIYIELLGTIDGKRCFKTFYKDDFFAAFAFLHKGGFFDDDPDLLENAKMEMFKLERRVDGLQHAIFNTELPAITINPVAENPQDTAVDVKPVQPAQAITVNGNELGKVLLSEHNDEFEDPDVEIVYIDADEPEVDTAVVKNTISSLIPALEQKASEKTPETEYYDDENGWEVKKDTTLPEYEEDPAEGFDPQKETKLEVKSIYSPSVKEVIVPNECLEYAKKFMAMQRTEENMISSSDKALVLLSLITLFERDSRMNTRILCNDNFISIYEEQYEKYHRRKLVNNHKPRLAFLAMGDNIFWRKANVIYTPSGTIKDLAEIDFKLAELLRQRKHRSALKKVLYHTYFKH